MRYTPRQVPRIGQSATGYTMTESGFEKEQVQTAHESDSLGDMVWREYASATKRTDGEGLPSDLVSDLSEALALWSDSPEHTIASMARSAAYLNPHDGDESDYGRLLSVFTDSKKRMIAEDSLKDLRSSAVPFSDAGTVQDRMNYVLDYFGGQEIESFNDEDQSIIYQLSRIPREIFLNSYRIAHSSREKEGRDVRPRDVLQVEKDKGSLYPAVTRKKNEKVVETKHSAYDDYGAGRVEEKTLNTEEMDVDLDAQIMINRGYPMKTVMMFHEDVPRGYWKAILEFIDSEESNGDPDVAYSELEEEFRFHPSEREKPGLI